MKRRIFFTFLVFMMFFMNANEKSVTKREFQKLQTVLQKMSERCKNEIPNGNPNEFLQDLYEVLNEENDNFLILVDKKHNIGKNYVPKELIPLVKNENYVINKKTLSLTKTAESALNEMAIAAKNDGIVLDVSSTYRSYETQERTFNYWVSVDGLEEAERESARAGTSQHQLGTAVDFGNIDDSFSKTKQCAWLNKNASDFGWSLSFPQGYEDVTGYRWECWHFRYIGKKACSFQKKWFNNVQQFMLEFIDEWKSLN